MIYVARVEVLIRRDERKATRCWWHQGAEMAQVRDEEWHHHRDVSGGEGTDAEHAPLAAGRRNQQQDDEDEPFAAGQVRQSGQDPGKRPQPVT